jgi:hypothetical protein
MGPPAQPPRELEGGSRIGARYQHTTPGDGRPHRHAIEQRLRLVLGVAEQALEAHPSRSTHSLCLVELRGFDP